MEFYLLKYLVSLIIHGKILLIFKCDVLCFSYKNINSFAYSRVGGTSEEIQIFKTFECATLFDIFIFLNLSGRSSLYVNHIYAD